MRSAKSAKSACLVVLGAVVVACGAGAPEAADPGPGWSVILEEGDARHGPESFWAARLVTSGSGVLLIANLEQTPFDGYDLRFTIDGETWTKSKIEPPDGYTQIELWVTVPTPDEFLLAGVASNDSEGDRRVVMWVGDGIQWEPVEDMTSGLPGVVSELIKPMCLCGFLHSVVSTEQGLIGVGVDADNLSAVWSSVDGEQWSRESLGPTSYSGVVGAASLADQIYAVGATTGFSVWTSDNLTGWETVGDGAEFGLPVYGSGSGLGEGEDSTFTGQFLALTSSADSLWSLMKLRVARGEDWCTGPVEDCNHDTLALYQSTDGETWERLALPEEMRWASDRSSMVSFDGTLLIAETGDGRLQVWATTDPAADSANSAPGAVAESTSFVALRPSLDDVVRDYSTLDLEAPTAVDVNSGQWGTVRVGLTGRQTEVTLVLEVAGRYLGSEGVFAPVDEPQVLALRHGETVELDLEVSGTPLETGLHQFQLEIPAWINAEGVADDSPDGSVALTMTYNVFDDERIERTKSFCTTVIPLVDGLEPSDRDFGAIRELARDLESEVRAAVLAAADQVQAEINNETTFGYDTTPLVAAVSDACGRYDLYSIAAMS